MDSSSPQPVKNRIWILEDSPLETEAARQVLSERFAVETYSDGASLLEQLSLREAPDVLLIDWNMPGMSGVEVCRFIRQTRDELSLPILIFTATMPRESIVEALRSGANDFIPKPYFGEELLARVTTQVRVRCLAKDASQLVVFERQLIGIVSHDLRNPLSAILAGAEVLSKTPLEARPASFAARILSSAQRCKRLISDILDFTQARSGRSLPMVMAPVDLKSLVQEVIDEVRSAHHGDRIELTSSGNLDGFWDPDRLNQMMANLVGNSLQYSPTGSKIRIGLSDEGNAVRISVNNEGEVIAPEVQQRMFKPMERGTLGKDKLERSVGLGLYIVDLVVKAHGGTVEVTSNESSGTTFLVRLPKQAPSSVHPGPEAGERATVGSRRPVQLSAETNPMT